MRYDVCTQTRPIQHRMPPSTPRSNHTPKKKNREKNSKMEIKREKGSFGCWKRIEKAQTQKSYITKQCQIHHTPVDWISAPSETLKKEKREKRGRNLVSRSHNEYVSFGSISRPSFSPSPLLKMHTTPIWNCFPPPNTTQKNMLNIY